jgi:hypothetical protein
VDSGVAVGLGTEVSGFFSTGGGGLVFLGAPPKSRSSIPFSVLVFSLSALRSK